MPTSGRGGRRNGKPGQQYPNRTDMAQAPRAVPGQTYGVAAQQVRAQQQMPLPQQPVPGTAAPAPAVQQAPMQPGGLGPLTGPTQRPNEPLTAGLSYGAGPGPEAIAPPDPLAKFASILNSLPNVDSSTAQLRQIVNATLGNQGAA